MAVAEVLKCVQVEAFVGERAGVFKQQRDISIHLNKKKMILDGTVELVVMILLPLGQLDDSARRLSGSTSFGRQGGHCQNCSVVHNVPLFIADFVITHALYSNIGFFFVIDQFISLECFLNCSLRAFFLIVKKVFNVKICFSVCR